MLTLLLAAAVAGQGRAPAAKPVEKPAEKPATNADGTPQRYRQYTIAKGDSLSSIARKNYGDAGPARISAIFNANRDKMTSVNSLPKIGTVIRMASAMASAPCCRDELSM